MADDIPPLGFVVDRHLQRDLLLAMRRVYPSDIVGYPDQNSGFDVMVQSQAIYLAEHGLCKAGRTGDTRSSLQITAAGIDLLENDGGPGAISSAETVALDAASVRATLIAKLKDYDLPASRTDGLVAAIDNMSRQALAAAVEELMNAGVEHAPASVLWIERLAG